MGPRIESRVYVTSSQNDEWTMLQKKKKEPCCGRLNVNSVSYKNVRGYLQTGKLGQTNESGVGRNLGNFGEQKSSSSW